MPVPFPIEPVMRHRRLLFAALLVFDLAGCEQLGLGKKTENPVVPPPPQRILPAETAPEAKKPGSDPVKLDGSAANQLAPTIGNAPALAAAPAAMASDSDGPSKKARPGAHRQAGKSDDSADPKDSLSSGESAEAEDADAAPHGKGTPSQITQAEARPPADDSKPVSSTTVPIGFTSPIELEGHGRDFEKVEVAALVNGVPIFSEDILRQLPLEGVEYLAAAEKKLPPDKFEALRQDYVSKLLPSHIEQELVLQALKTKLKPEQLEGIKKQLDAQYKAHELPGIMKKFGVTTEGELEAKLQERGSSLETMRTIFRNRELTRQYIGTKTLVREGFDRPEILKYYQDHLDKYAIQAKVKWEQIQLSYAKHGGKEGAKKKAAEILERLKKGEVFAVIAKECSNGATARKGGLWGWTAKGNLRDKEVETALFERPKGEVGEPIETPLGIEIIRVIDRTEADYEPFESVQEDIKNQLKSTLFQKRVAELMKELTEKATIEKFTDRRSAAPPASTPPSRSAAPADPATQASPPPG
ncbi:MAG TPA: peptidylprolyl isomerase [Planctomycetaceae bacterium]|nr:peptidylprolyl isomerase [Planctomycetaceae bacterium]